MSAEEDNRPRAVVLVGPQASGKSTLGNFFLTKRAGPKAKEVWRFKEGNSFIKGQTQAVQVQYDDASKLYYIDTPGINDQNDLENMIEVLKVCRTFAIAAVVIVTPYLTRADVEKLAVVKYYSELFQPVFENCNSVLIMNQVNKEHFEDLLEGGFHQLETEEERNLLLQKMKQDEALKLTKLEARLEIRRIHFSDLIGHNIDVIEVLEPVISENDLAISLQLLDTSKPNAKYWNSLPCHSLTVRERLIQQFQQRRSVDMRLHNFALPPQFRAQQQSQTATLRSALFEKQKTLKDEQSAHASLLKTIDSLKDEMTKAETKVKVARNQIHQKSGRKQLQSKFKWGNSRFNLGILSSLLGLDASPTIPNISFPIPPDLKTKKDLMKLACLSHNASFRRNIAMENDSELVADFVPDWFSLRTRDSKDDIGLTAAHNWWLRVWIEFNGDDVYADDIKVLNETVNSELESIRQLSTTISAKNSEAQIRGGVMQEHAERISEIEKQLDLLRKQFYALEEVEKLKEALSFKVKIE